MVVCLELLRVNDKTYRKLVTNLEVDFFLRFRCFPELVWICDEVGVFDKVTTISQIEYWVASSHAKFKFSLQIIEKRTVNSSQKIRFYKSLDFFLDTQLISVSHKPWKCWIEIFVYRVLHNFGIFTLPTELDGPDWHDTNFLDVSTVCGLSSSP